MILSEAIRAVQEGRARMFMHKGVRYAVENGRLMYVDDNNRREPSCLVQRVDFLLSEEFQLILFTSDGFKAKE